MPTKERYRKLVKAENKCPKCGRLRDNHNFVTCSICRKERSLEKKHQEVRTGAMNLFGIKK